MIDFDEHNYRQLLDKILSIISNRCNTHLFIEQYLNKQQLTEIVVLTPGREICSIHGIFYFKSAQHYIQCALNYPIQFHVNHKFIEYDISKEIGSTLEELIVACDLNV